MVQRAPVLLSALVDASFAACDLACQRRKHRRDILDDGVDRFELLLEGRVEIHHHRTVLVQNRDLLFAPAKVAGTMQLQHAPLQHAIMPVRN
jgi:hypothetical protein